MLVLETVGESGLLEVPRECSDVWPVGQQRSFCSGMLLDEAKRQKVQVRAMSSDGRSHSHGAAKSRGDEGLAFDI